MQEKQSLIIIGGGIGGLATANLFAKSGHKVTLIEKNKNLGGKANVFTKDGFVFDMGPSWYLMPEIFEHHYGLLGEDVNKHLDLIKLNPSYRAFFEDDKSIDISPSVDETANLFESIEPGAGDKFKKYIKQSSFQYKTAYDNFLFKNYDGVFDFLNWDVVSKGLRMNLFIPIERFVGKYFTNHKLHKILEYTLVFLGSSPYNAPALYALMSHVDFVQGVFYPKGGLYKLIESMESIAIKNGVNIIKGEEVEKIIVSDKTVSGVKTVNGEYRADIVVSNADIWHTEQKLIKDTSLHMYDQKYWDKMVMAPSAFLLYIGLNKKVDGILHHNLYFRNDWQQNFDDIFKTKNIPENPCFYVCCPTKTDDSIAPVGKDSLFVLVPFPDGVYMDDNVKSKYQEYILDMIEKNMSINNIRESIEYISSYDAKNFELDYNVLGGSALGFAHTLMQSAYFRTKNKHSKIKNLYFVGAGTTPGIGMPMCLISAELVYKRVYGINNSGPLNSL
jgi:phytoene desaturase